MTNSPVYEVTSCLFGRRHGLLDQIVFVLSVRAVLSAKEIANLKGSMIRTPEGEVSDAIHLTNAASKGRSGRVIPLNKQLR